MKRYSVSFNKNIKKSKVKLVINLFDCSGNEINNINYINFSQNMEFEIDSKYKFYYQKSDEDKFFFLVKLIIDNKEYLLVPQEINLEEKKPFKHTSLIVKLLEINDLIDQAFIIFNSKESWQNKFELIFNLDIQNKIEKIGHKLKWYNLDATYEESIISYFEALIEFRKNYIDG